MAIGLFPMSARLKELDRDIADVERHISAKNEIIISGLRLGNDTIAEEAQVGEMNTVLQRIAGRTPHACGRTSRTSADARPGCSTATVSPKINTEMILPGPHWVRRKFSAPVWQMCQAENSLPIRSL